MLKLQVYSVQLCMIDQKHPAFMVGDRFRVPPLPIWAGHKVWRYSLANLPKLWSCRGMPSCREKEGRALRKRAGEMYFRCCCTVQPEARALLPGW